MLCVAEHWFGRHTYDSDEVTEHQQCLRPPLLSERTLSEEQTPWPRRTVSRTAQLPAMSSQGHGGRLKIVSNRLPVSVSNGSDDQYSFNRSSGGLVAGLSGLAKGGPAYTWYGWPGIEIPKEHVEHVAGKLREEHNCVPVLLDQELAERYYDGFSSKSYTVFNGRRAN